MTNDPMSTEIEERLRDAGAPDDPPERLHALAREAALGSRPVVMHTRTIHPRGRFGRFALAAHRHREVFDRRHGVPPV